TGSDGIVQLSSQSGSSQDMFEQPIGDWYFWSVSRSSTGTINVYYGTDPDNLTHLTPSATGEWDDEDEFSNLHLGESTWGAEWLNGNLAAVKVYNRVLSESEVQEEARYYNPVSSDGLYASYSFWD